MAKKEEERRVLTAEERARIYIARLPASVQGSNGRKSLMRAVYAAVVGFELTEEQALPIIREYNTTAEPRWSERDLVAKVKYAATHSGSNGQRGRLLNDSRYAHTPGKPPPQSPQNAPVPASTGRPRYAFRAPREAASRAHERVSGLRMPSLSEQAQIARLRHLCPYVPVLAANLDILRVGVNRGLPAFFLIGERTLQARRMDGQEWSVPGRKPFKVDTIGKVGDAGIWWNFGPKTRRVIVTEGLVSSLEILECFMRAEDEAGLPIPADVGFLAVYQAGAKLTEDEAASFRGKRVLVLADRGAAGFESAKDHRQAMREKGVRDVRAFQFTGPAEDLGGFLRESPACPPDLLRFILP